MADAQQTGKASLHPVSRISSTEVMDLLIYSETPFTTCVFLELEPQEKADSNVQIRGLLTHLFVE